MAAHGFEDRIFTQDEIQDLLEELQTLVFHLGDDYERLTRSGKDSYDDLCMLLKLD